MTLYNVGLHDATPFASSSRRSVVGLEQCDHDKLTRNTAMVAGSIGTPPAGGRERVPSARFTERTKVAAARLHRAREALGNTLNAGDRTAKGLRLREISAEIGRNLDDKTDMAWLPVVGGVEQTDTEIVKKAAKTEAAEQTADFVKFNELASAGDLEGAHAIGGKYGWSSKGDET